MILIPIGTKAQLIKMAPVLLALKKKSVPFRFILTGQHQESMQDLITCFQLPKPDVILLSETESDTPIKLLRWFFKTLPRMLAYIKTQSIDGMMVHGDTLSTLWGAIIAKCKGIPVYHVEAGLRSFRWNRPFPEECIRVAVTYCADVLFAPGDWAVHNLQKHQHKTIINTEHNTLLDALQFALQTPPPPSPSSLPYLVVSIHRAENVLHETTFRNIISMIIAMKPWGTIKFVLHPITRTYLEKYALLNHLREANIELLERMNYIEFIQLLRHSRGLVTDGGSNQEESFYMGLPCLLMRKETERQEGLGNNVTLAYLDRDKTLAFVARCFQNTWTPHALPKEHPSARIAEYFL